MATGAASSGGGQSRQSEFIVRVPEKNEMKRMSILKFNGSLKVDPTEWKTGQLELERVEGKATTAGVPTVQEYGEGTEYGKAARDEARRKRLGRQMKNYSIDNQPWKMKIRESDGRERRLKSIREDSAGKHADYWLFLKTGNEFHAVKVDDWHNFIPCVSHRTLDIDEAEEEFLRRNQVMNQFALKAQLQDKMKQKEMDEEVEEKKGRGGLKIKDEMSSSGSEGEGEDGEGERERKKNTKKKNGKPRKDKKVKVENSDDVAKYESEDGEDEGREYDYMSDSGSDSEREQVVVDEKVEKELVGVAEEEGMRKMMDSDEESDEDDDDPTKKLLNRKDGDDKKRIDIEERDSSGEDSEVEDMDKDNLDSVILMPKKGSAGEGGGSSASGSPPPPHPSTASPSPPPTTAAPPQGTKRSAEDATGTSLSKGPEAKKAKAEEKEEGLSEEMVRRLLRTKPHTTKELLTKIKSRCGNKMEKPEMVTKLAAILKKIEPHQFKQKQGKKEVLFFSLSNTIS